MSAERKITHPAGFDWMTSISKPLRHPAARCTSSRNKKNISLQETSHVQLAEIQNSESNVNDGRSKLQRIKSKQPVGPPTPPSVPRLVCGRPVFRRCLTGSVLSLLFELYIIRSSLLERFAVEPLKYRLTNVDSASPKVAVLFHHENS